MKMKGVEATWRVEIKKNPYDHIRIVTKPVKTQYVSNSSSALDLKGLVFYAYKDKTETSNNYDVYSYDEYVKAGNGYFTGSMTEEKYDLMKRMFGTYLGEDEYIKYLDNGKHEVGIPGGENGIMQYFSRNLPDHGVGHALILPGCLTPGGRGSEVEDASRFKGNDRTHPAVDRVKNHMDFPFINIKEIETGFALNLDDASGGVALLGAKMQYLVPCRSHVSDLWNGKWGEQGQLAG